MKHEIIIFEYFFPHKKIMKNRFNTIKFVLNFFPTMQLPNFSFML